MKSMDLNRCVTVQLFFSFLSPGKTRLTLSLAQEWLILGMWQLQPFSWRRLWAVILDALTPALVLSFEALSLFLSHFSLPANFLLICFNRALGEQPAFAVLTFCGLYINNASLWMADRHLDNCQVSSAPCDCGCLYCSRLRDKQHLYCLNYSYITQIWNDIV